MSASLCIEVIDIYKKAIQEINFFEAGDWNMDSEKELLLKMQDLLSVVRHIGTTCDIKISIEVKDIPAALFLINKKTSSHLVINNQKLSIREIEVLGLIMQGLTKRSGTKWMRYLRNK
ncbi:MAG TPA: hypothetical protein VK484_14715 [Ferruginibacter sp.]|nr:hypothetical protein [Ferruginibacter sp.]